MNSAIFISSGLGNALLLTPLVHALKNAGHKVTAIFNSPFNCENLYANSNLFDEKVILKTKMEHVLYILKNKNKFDQVYLDYFACTKKNFKVSNRIAQKIIAHGVPDSIDRNKLKHITVVRPSQKLNNAEINLQLFNDEVRPLNFDLKLKFNDVTKFNLPKKYIVVQPSAGNNLTPYKIWNIDNWISLIKANPEEHFVILGDKNELQLANKITKENLENTTCLIGLTSLPEVFDILKFAQLYLGHDSGIMHMAAAVSIPTITIWGGSNYNLFGYEKVAPNMHKTIAESPNCWPCNSWLNPNKNRVENPDTCPDFKCLTSITVKSFNKIFTEFKAKVC